MSNRIFYILTAGFGLGIFVSSFFKMGFSFFLFLLFLSVIIFIYGQFIIKNGIKIILLALFIFSLSLGILRYEIKEIRIANSDLQSQIGEKVILEGIIVDEPSVKEQIVQLSVSINGEKILVSTGLFPEFHYGDQIQVEGKLERPESFETENGNDFDYIGFLAKDDIFYQISFAQVKLISSGHGSFIKTKLFAFKNAFISKINLLIKEPESALLNGLILGAKNSLGKELQNDFRLAGVSHIVALSGYNITIVAVGIMAILSFLPRTISLGFGAFGIILFAIMTGGTATVMRSSIMALIVLLAKFTNRKFEITRALLLAGIFMLIQNPKILVFDISFQLSFLSTIALIFVSPLFEKKMFIHRKYMFQEFFSWLADKQSDKFKLKEIFIATISTQIFVLPFLIYKMGLISIFGLFANVLILPFIPWIMLFGFITGMIGFISTILAMPIAFITSLLLTYMLKVIYFFSHLPFSSFGLKNFPLSLTIMIYLIFLVLIWRSRFTYKNEKYS